MRTGEKKERNYPTKGENNFHFLEEYQNFKNYEILVACDQLQQLIKSIFDNFIIICKIKENSVGVI